MAEFTQTQQIVGAKYDIWLCQICSNTSNSVAQMYFILLRCYKFSVILTDKHDKSVSTHYQNQ